MAKRSPILGYNHNVRYRGLVFHVQTEDSGLLNPHLFTHLFYGGVIVSTRKLVYDAGANEEAIKALMQAQHKAVMKDLRRGSFDDKIDQYLGGTPGLEPRSAAAPSRPSAETLDEPAGAPATKTIDDVAVRLGTVEEPVLELVPEAESPAVEPVAMSAKPRTQTADRTSASSQVRAVPPPAALDDNAPTLSGDAAASVAAAVHAANAKTVPTAATTTSPLHISVRTPSGPLAGRTPTPPSVPRASTPPRPGAPLGPPIPSPPVPRRSLPQDFRIDSSPEIEISIDDDPRQRTPRDTLQTEQTIPTVTADVASGPARRSDSVPPGPRRSPTGERPASHVGATLPPGPRPAARPSITPPQVVTRPVPPAEGKQRDSDVIEVYAPAPGAIDSPTERERPGQYSVSRSKNPSESVQMREQTGRMEKIETAPTRPQPRPAPPPTPSAARQGPPSAPRMATPAAGLPAARPTEPPARASTAPRTAQPAPPAASRPGAGTGVVMTRPAVIVGAPPKAPATQPRVRKAREDEGRTFGQGLISEKSLDEVILAYLSEDAEEK